MNVFKYPKLWVNCLFKPEEAIKILETKKIGLWEGIISTAYMGLLVGLLNFVLVLIEGFTWISAISSIIGIPLLYIICLLGFSFIYRLVANFLRGKAKYSDTIGFFGIFMSVMIIAMFPMIITEMISILFFIDNVTGAYTGTYYIISGIGILITMIAFGLLLGVFFEILSKKEGVKTYRLGLIYGTTIGMIFFLLFLLNGIITYIFPMPY